MVFIVRFFLYLNPIQFCVSKLSVGLCIGGRLIHYNVFRQHSSVFDNENTMRYQ